MTYQEALTIVKKKFPDKNFVTCTMYKNWYIFAYDEKKNADDILLDPFIGVDKTNGNCGPFFPSNDIPGFLRSERINL